MELAVQLAATGGRKENEAAIALFSDLYSDGHRVIDCLMGISQCNMRLGNVHAARLALEQLLKMDPHNDEAHRAHAAIVNKVYRVGPVGLALLAGAAVAAVFVARKLLARKQ
jgi:hypothetical protein